MAGITEGRLADWFCGQLAKVAEPPRTPAEIRATDHLRDDLAIDSLAFIELMVEFEETFGARLSEMDLLPGQYETVHDLIHHIHQCLAATE